jgi:predicted component of type VI protein secretion system
MSFTPPQLILTELPPGVAIVAPAGLEIGGALTVPLAVQGRWITIGAGPDQDLVIQDRPASISRSHCRMLLRGGAYLIQGRLHPPGYALDGQWFNDCTARPLRDGDLVTIGQHATFRFSLPGPG